MENLANSIMPATARRSTRRLLIAACSATALAGGALAAAPATDTAPGGDIVVTARKQSERLQDVPLSVSAISASTLTDRNQSKIQDYFASVPGLNLNAQGNGQTNIAIRGITTGETTNPAVGIVIDDIPFGSSSALAYSSRLLPDLDPASLSQIEVLRGPQGTLYGASSIGGLLKFVTAAPSLDRTSGRVEAGINSVAHGEIGFDGRGSINLPIGDKIAIRASGFFRRDGGYYDNVRGGDNVNRLEAYGGLASLLAKPTERLTLRLSALAQNSHGYGAGDYDSDYRGRPLLGELEQSRIPNVDRYKIDARLYSANLAWDLGGVQLTSLTGYGISRYDGTIESTRTYGDLTNAYLGIPGAALVNRFKTRKFSQEARLSSSGQHLIDWTIGGFYTREKSAADQQLIALSATGANAGLLLDSQFPSTFREIAGFGTLTLHLGERFDIQAGARYSDIRQTYDELDLGPLGGGYTVSQRSHNRKATYLVTPRFRISRDLMLYGRVTTGYRPGGPNPLSTADAQANGVPTQYSPDTTTSYEIGAKGNLIDRHLTYDLSAYVIDWKGIQLSLTNPTNGFIYFINGPSARSAGAEASLSLRLDGGFHATANASYNDAKLTKDLPLGSGYGHDGDRLPFSAHFTSSLSIDQDLKLDDRLTASFGGTITYVGRRLGEFGASATVPRPIFPSYTSLDLRAGLRRDGWTLNLFATNITDKRGIVGMTPMARTPTVNSVWAASAIRPRTIGLSVARTF